MRFKLFKHFCLITKHRHQVIRNAWHMGIFFHSLAHDLSKYSPLEFFTSAKYYNGKRTPIFFERQEFNGYSKVANHHCNRNKHHWQYYVDFGGEEMVVCNIPYKYAVEYVCDTLAASRIYNKASFNRYMTYEYFISHASLNYFTVATYEFIAWCLFEYSKNGFKGLKKRITKKKYQQLVALYPQVKRYKPIELE